MCRACVLAWGMRILKDRRLLEEEEAEQRRKEKRSKECVYLQLKCHPPTPIPRSVPLLRRYIPSLHI